MDKKKTPLKKAPTVSKKKPLKKTAKTAVVKKSLKKTAAAAAHKKTKTVSAIKKVHNETRTVAMGKKPSHKKRFETKRTTYMVLSVILGVLLGETVNLFVELVYMKQKLAVGEAFTLNRYLGLESFLPVPFALYFLLSGLAVGIWLGIWGWRMVYVEHKHRMFRSRA